MLLSSISFSSSLCLAELFWVKEREQEREFRRFCKTDLKQIQSLQTMLF
jgi:hypothetical protein